MIYQEVVPGGWPILGAPLLAFVARSGIPRPILGQPVGMPLFQSETALAKNTLGWRSALRLRSYRARKELAFPGEIWEKSFYDGRVRAAEDYYNFKQYIRQNPIKQGLSTAIADYPYSSTRRNS